MKVCVFGAGAIGGHVAVRLAQGGADVSVIARGAHLAAMREKGIELHAPDGTIRVKVRCAEQAEELGPQDAVFCTVKAPGLASFAAGVGPLLGPDTPVAFVMNGVPWWFFHGIGGANEGGRLPRLDPADAVWNAVGPERAVGGVVYSACTVIAPGVIETEEMGRVFLGEPSHRPSTRVDMLAKALTHGGFKGVPTERIRDEMWSKLALNAASGPLGVLTTGTPQQFLVEPALEACAVAVIKEVEAVARAYGSPIDAMAEKRIARNKNLAHKASILQDLELGRPMEVDAIYVVVQEMARAAGVPTPLLDLTSAMVRVRARIAGLYSG